MANGFTNPFTNPKGFFSSQPGGFFAAPQGGRTLTGLLGDPRVNIGLAIAQGQPLGKAIFGGALQSAQVRKALEPEEDTARVSKIKGLVTRLQATDPNLTDTEALNKATDIVDGNLQIEFNPDTRTFTTFDPISQKIETSGGPLQNTETIQQQTTLPAKTTQQEKMLPATDKGIKDSIVIESYLKPGDFTKKQLEKHKTRISNIDEALPELKRSIDKTDNIFGISNKFARAGGNIAGITPDFIDKYLINPEVEQATQEYKLVKEKIVKQLTDNPKFPVAEVNRLLEMLPDESAIFLDPQKAKIQLTTLYNGLQTMTDNAKSALTGQAVASDPYEIPIDPTEQNPFVDQLLNKYR